jgi:hypothetical protein
MVPVMLWYWYKTQNVKQRIRKLLNLFFTGDEITTKLIKPKHYEQVSVLDLRQFTL